MLLSNGLGQRRGWLMSWKRQGCSLLKWYRSTISPLAAALPCSHIRLSLTAMWDKYWKMSFKWKPQGRVWYFQDGFIKGWFLKHKCSSMIRFSPICVLLLPAQFERSFSGNVVFILKNCFQFFLSVLPFSLCPFICFSLLFFESISLGLCPHLSLALTWYNEKQSFLSCLFSLVSSQAHL